MSKPNEFTKSTNMFARALNSILKKSDMPMETPSMPDGIGEGKDALVDECLSMLNDGSLPADPQKVQEWATSKGMSEDEAADFAEAILTDYFNSDEDMQKGDLPMDDDEDDDDYEDDDDEEDSELEEELQKATLALSHRMSQIDKKLAKLGQVEKNLEILTKGLTTLLVSNSDLVQTNNMMKASLEKLGGFAISKASPIYSSTGNQPVGLQSMDFKTKKEIIMKGIQAGHSFNPAEVNLFESSLGTNLTENIKNYILQNKAGK